MGKEAKKQKDKVEIKRINCQTFDEDFFDITKQHYKEIGITLNEKDDPQYEINKAKYYAAELYGRYVVMGLYVNGKPSGYIAAFLEEHLYSHNQLTGMIHAVYALPEVREKGYGAQLFTSFETLLQDMGINILRISIGGRGDLEEYLTKKGYSRQDIIYGKILKQRENK